MLNEYLIATRLLVGEIEDFSMEHALGLADDADRLLDEIEELADHVELRLEGIADYCKRHPRMANKVAAAIIDAKRIAKMLADVLDLVADIPEVRRAIRRAGERVLRAADR